MRLSDWSSDVCSSDLVALDRGDLEVDVRERGRAAAFGGVEVHHQRRDSLAAALERPGRARHGRIEVVVMRAVLRAHAVAHDLDRLAVRDRHVYQSPHATLDALDQSVATTREEGACRTDKRSAGNEWVQP